MKKNRKTYLFISVCIPIIVAALLVWKGENVLSLPFFDFSQTSSIPLTNVVDIYPGREGIYLIEDNGASIAILKIDEEGNLLERIEKQPKTNEKQGTFSTFKNLWVDQEERVYVLQTISKIEDRALQEEMIWECDFQNKKLVEIGKISHEAKNNSENRKGIVQMRVDAGVISYISYGNQENEYQEILLKRMEKDSAPTTIAVIEDSEQAGISEFVWDENYNLVYINQKGAVYLYDTNQKREKLYPVTEEKKKGKALHLSMDEEHNVYFTDVTAQQIQKFHMPTKEMTTIVGDTSQYFAQEVDASLKYSDLKRIRYQDNSFVGVIFTAARQQQIGVFKNAFSKHQIRTEKIIDTVKVEKELLWKLIFRIFLFWAIGSAGCFLCLVLFFQRKNFKIPIVIKMICVLVPLTVLGIWGLRERINRIFLEELTNSQNTKMHREAKEKITAMNRKQLRKITIANAFADKDFVAARSAYYDSYALDTHIQSGLDKKQQEAVKDTSYQYVYKVEGNGLYTMFCGEQTVGIPLSYNYSDDIMKIFQTAVRENKIIKCKIADKEGSWSVLVVPIQDDTGKVTAVMEVGSAEITIQHLVSKNAHAIQLQIESVMFTLLIILSIVLYISLFPLKKLKEEATAIGEGTFGVKVPVKGRDEISEISEIFNRMSENIAYSMGEMKQFNESCYKFIPSKMFELLNNSSVREARLGEQTSKVVTVMDVKVADFEKKVADMSAENMFHFINQNLAQIVPPISENRGVIDRFDKGGVLAFYTEECERALVSAISICKNIEKKNRVKKAEKEEPIQIAIGMSYGSIMLGIVGHEERLEATTVSEYTNLTALLQKIAIQYSAHIVITDAAVNEIEDFDTKFNRRFLGLVRICATNQIEKIYDVYDGDKQEQRAFKQQTKTLFEQGVGFYCEKKFYDARLAFIEVLKQSRKDKAAKEYVILCDKYYRMKNTDSIDVCLKEN